MQKMIAALVKDEKGNVLILVPAFLLLATFFLALVVDLGSVHYCRARLQDAADAAALAAAGRAREGEPAAEAAEAEARKYIEYHGLEDPSGELPWFVFDPAGCTVTVVLKVEAPLYFGPAFGVDTVTLGARATAGWNPAGVSLVP